MDTFAEYGRQILSLIAVFSLLGLTVWKLGRHRGTVSMARLRSTFWKPKDRSRDRVLEPVERLALTPQHVLHVVRFRGTEMLVATHPQGCTLLDREQGRPAQLASRGAGA
jgi:Flagellar biosynthesis protein, FliO